MIKIKDLFIFFVLITLFTTKIHSCPTEYAKQLLEEGKITHKDLYGNKNV